MKSRSTAKISIFLFLLTLVFPARLDGWSEHPLLVRPALKDLQVWNKMVPVKAVSLHTFLAETEKELAVFLAGQEAWSKTNLPDYTPCPEGLAFKATGNPDDILLRFYKAIRINPNVKIPLYLHLLPNDSKEGRPVASPSDITSLKDVSSFLRTTYVWIKEGEILSPLDVLCTASDEPDYGFDLGLFEDNNTDYGKQYGFGAQPFGNPNLEYGSQAPFHMGFYHEAAIVYKFGSFLKHTYLDYRIFLFKALSEFAFRHQQPYWGWRFMGWGMHYMGDVSMPYHMKPLPGVSTTRLMWISVKSMVGAPKAQENATQLVSNRHTVLEEFQLQVLRKALIDNNASHPFLLALKNPVTAVPFSYDFLINVATRQSASQAIVVDKALKKNMPFRLVSDPAVEASDLPETYRIVACITEEKGQEAIDEITGIIAKQLQQYSMHIRSFMEAVLDDSGL